MDVPSRGPAARLQFLDAVRGIAALSVAFGHRAEGTIPGFGHFDATGFRFGQFGVILFFLCSGFIIPASLERHGSLVRFWISRCFRLFPLYWAVLTAALVLHVLGRYELPAAYLADPAAATAANATMLQAFLHEPLALGLSWTLAFEMGFYVAMSGLFVAGLNRRSPALAALLLACVVALAAHSAGASRLVVGATVIVPLAIAAVIVTRVPRRRLPVLPLLAVLGALLLFNDFYAPWFCALLFASMFTGTALHRWSTGRLGTREAAALYLGAIVVTTGACALDADRASFAPTVLAAYVAFGAALALRRRAFPRPLVRLGVISYSLYLVHPLVYGMLGNALTQPVAVRLVALVGALALSVGLSAITYRWIEAPMIALGHELATRWARRQGTFPAADRPAFGGAAPDRR